MANHFFSTCSESVDRSCGRCGGKEPVLAEDIVDTKEVRKHNGTIPAFMASRMFSRESNALMN